MRKRQFMRVVVASLLFGITTPFACVSAGTTGGCVVGNGLVPFCPAILIVLSVGSAILLMLFGVPEKKKAHLPDRPENRITAEDYRAAPTDAQEFSARAGRILLNHPEARLGLLCFDIYQFRLINILYGRAAGEAVLGEISGILNRHNENNPHFCMGCIPTGEFYVLNSAENIRDLGQSVQEFERIVSQNGMLHPLLYRVQFRFGRYFAKPGEVDVRALMEKAMLAHDLAKDTRVSIYDYDDSVIDGIHRENELLRKAEEALKNGAFQIYLQPKYTLKDNRIAGAEALARWLDADGTFISPGEFIPVFERNGLVQRLDMYMFESVCRMLRKWMDDGRQMVPISVNFSKLHIDNESFVPQLSEFLRRYDVSARFIEIEFTESAMLQYTESLQRIMEQLHSLGFCLSMDDFGTGYSTLSLMKNLPFDVIKIDRSFFWGIRDGERARKLIASVIQMNRDLGMQTVAEGVETREMCDFLRQVDCEMVQGYYFARPMPEPEFLRLVEGER